MSAKAPQISSIHGKPTEGTRIPVEYICQMHPEVRQPGPGACPKCGMVLGPVEVSLAPPTKTEYTCPMHPEIVWDGLLSIRSRRNMAVELRWPFLYGMTSVSMQAPEANSGREPLFSNELNFCETT